VSPRLRPQPSAVHHLTPVTRRIVDKAEATARFAEDSGGGP